MQAMQDNDVAQANLPVGWQSRLADISSAGLLTYGKRAGERTEVAQVAQIVRAWVASELESWRGRDVDQETVSRSSAGDLESGSESQWLTLTTRLLVVIIIVTSRVVKDQTWLFDDDDDDDDDDDSKTTRPIT
jgi:hypothetical protein